MWWWPFGRSSTRQVYPFTYEQTLTLGEMARPVIPVNFWSIPDKDWQKVALLVDTGADLTLIPRYTAAFLGLDYQNASELQTQGVGGALSIKYVENVRIKIGDITRSIPVGVTAGHSVPPLLGRHLALETLKTTIDKSREIVVEG